MFRQATAGAWRVLVATFVTLGLTYGFWYAYSVFFVAFLREFGWSRLGAWIAGRIFDATGGYGLALPMAAGMALLAPALLWVVAPRRANPPPSFFAAR